MITARNFVLKIRMITTRIIAALVAPSAGLLTIVGALTLLYTVNPSRTQTYPSLGQTSFQGISRHVENIRNQEFKFSLTEGEGQDQKLVPGKILVVGDDGLVHLRAPPLLCAALRDQAMQLWRVKRADPSLEPSFSHSARPPTVSRSFFGQQRESR